MKGPKRILHVFGGMNRGGAETLVMNMYRQIDRTRIQFDFAVQAEQACHFDKEIESLGGRILRHPIPGSAGIGTYVRAFARTLAHSGPFAAVHSHVHLFSGVVLKMSHRQGVPVRISHSHSTVKTERYSLRRQAYRHCMGYLIRRSATHLLGCSRQACEALFGAACWDDRRVQTLPNAISLAEYVSPAGGDSLREQLHVLRAAPLIGHVGSFTEAKNHTFLIEVFRELHRVLPAASFVLAGDGADRPRIERLIGAYGLGGTVHLLGIRPDIPRIMGSLDLLLLPSLWEGLPVVLVEAQAAGVPCLVSDTVTPEADLNTGLVRFLSLRVGSERWAEQCLEQLKCARPSTAERSRALLSAGYDICDVTSRLAGIYLS
jgi:glycosyltransferase EpsF